MHGRALIESYIPGNEFAVEGVMTEGVFRSFAIFDKPDPLVGPFFEETIYVTPSRAPHVVQQAIVGPGRRRGAGARTPARADSRRVPREYEGRLRARGRGASDWRPVRSSRAVRRVRSLAHRTLAPSHLARRGAASARARRRHLSDGRHRTRPRA